MALKCFWQKLFVINVCLLGQLLPGTVEAKAVKLEHFDDSAGLRGRTIRQFAQEPSGLLWLGSEYGIEIHDGYDFKQLRTGATEDTVGGLEYISSVQTSRDGSQMLITSRKGMTIYDLISNTARHFPLKEAATTAHEAEQSIFVGTQSGVYIYQTNSDSSPKKIPGTEELSVKAIYSNTPDKVWLGTSNGLYLLNAKTLVLTTVNELHDVNVTHISEFKEHIWVATLRSGLYKLSKGAESVDLAIRHEPSGSANTIAGSSIFALAQVNSSQLWIGTDRGITVLEEVDTQINLKPLIISANPLDGLISSIFQDEGGTVWISTWHGVYKANTNTPSFSHFGGREQSGQPLTNNYTLSFSLSEEHQVWIGTASGLMKWNVDTEQLYSFNDNDISLAGTRVSAIAEIAGYLYVGTMAGTLEAFNRSDMTLIKSLHQPNSTSELPSKPGISKILKGRRGNIFVGTWGEGVYEINSELELVIPASDSALVATASLRVIDLAEDSEGKLWIIAHGHGVLVYNPIENVITDLSSSLPGLPEDFLRYATSIHINGQSVWIGTIDRGLLRSENGLPNFQVYTTDDGLASNAIYSIESHGDNIWVSGTNGLSKLNPKTQETLTFNSSHGLQADDFNNGASIKLSDGTLLFGGNNGFNAFDPTNIKLNEHKGQTLVTSFSKMNEPQPGRFRSDGSETLELNYKENVFSFEYALMDFASPKDNTFEYQLVGFDEDWVHAGTRNNVSYTNLDPGNYAFKVRGINNDGLPTDKIATVHVQIAPPPWLTWYAYTGYFLVALAITIIAFRLHAARIERLTNEKRNTEERDRLESLVAQRTEELNEKIKEQARTLHQKELANKEIHHRVKNNLQVILGLLTLQAETEENELFRSAMDVIRQRITSMSLIHKSLYEHSVATIDIKQYAENLIASIRQFHPAVANGQIEVILDVGRETMDIDTALPLGLILNELITNCLKHGFPEPSAEALNVIHIGFKRMGDRFEMTVSDNGRGLPEGFDVNSPASMGSELILIFAQQLQGEISAGSAPNGGAMFHLSFPIPVNPESQIEPVKTTESPS